MSSNGKVRTVEEALLAFHSKLKDELDASDYLTNKTFEEYAWLKFDAKEVLNILTSPKGTFPGLRPVLFAGLSAWIVNPSKKHNLHRSAITLAAAKLLHRAEIVGRRQHENPFLGGMRAKLMLLGPEFYNQIYYPIGGLAQLTKDSSLTSFRASLLKDALPMQRALTVMAIFHFHSEYLRNSSVYRPASINTAANLLDGLGDDAVSDWCKMKPIQDRSVKTAWSAFNPSIALSYAAYNIKINSNGSLLHAMVDGTATYADHGKHIPELIAKTAFISRNILAHCVETDTAKRTNKLLPPTEVGAMPLRIFSDKGSSWISKKFARDKDSKTLEWAPGGGRFGRE